jgi:hypothetical protein
MLEWALKVDASSRIDSMNLVICLASTYGDSPFQTALILDRGLSWNEHQMTFGLRLY